MRAALTYIPVQRSIRTSCSADSNPRPLVPEAYSILPYDSLKFPIIEIVKKYLVKDSLQFLVVP